MVPPYVGQSRPAPWGGAATATLAAIDIVTISKTEAGIPVISFFTIFTPLKLS
jgi:hypothetical protein